MSGVLTGIYMLATGAVANGWQASWHSRRQSRKLAVWQFRLPAILFSDGRVDVGLCRDLVVLAFATRFLFSTPTNMIQRATINCRKNNWL